MYDIKGGFFIGVELPFPSVAFRNCRADEDFAQVGLVQWEGDAIGDAWVLEKRFVKFPNCFRRYKVDGDFFAGGA